MVYEPREDSDLLASVVREMARGRVLDMGTGPQAIQAMAARENDEVTSVLAVDIDEEALESAREKEGIIVARSDLFEDVEGMFDTIIFNPPYLPSDDRAPDVALDGGVEGYELTQRFLKQAPGHLARGGRILLLISTLTGRGRIEGILVDLLLEQEVVKERKIAFETLLVYLIEKSPLLETLHERGISHIRRFSKGKRGLILAGLLDGQKVAVKAQRPDSPAKGTVDHEARILRRLNEVDIGPELLLSGEDWFCYRFIDGEFIEEAWPRKSAEEREGIIAQLLDTMRELDRVGVEKEEMTHPQKHVLVTPENEVRLVDFERARRTEEPSNVTQCLQYVAGLVGLEISRVKELGRRYKESYDDRDFEELKEAVLSEVS